MFTYCSGFIKGSSVVQVKSCFKISAEDGIPAAEHCKSNTLDARMASRFPFCGIIDGTKSTALSSSVSSSIKFVRTRLTALTSSEFTSANPIHNNLLQTCRMVQDEQAVHYVLLGL